MVSVCSVVVEYWSCCEKVQRALHWLCRRYPGLSDIWDDIGEDSLCPAAVFNFGGWFWVAQACIDCFGCAEVLFQKTCVFEDLCDSARVAF